ncbi:MAG: DUF192 domain-containing protein [Candidatus Staskawiczbacteria bacterium]|nr:DUF192 domain-containing protein [Candidatus Staskawiczbacteria bacterium]
MNFILEILLLVFAIVILICLFFYFAGTLKAPNIQESLSGSVCIKKNCFQVELAKTEAGREAGLMNRKELDKDKGMFFIFDKEGFYPFWMKNTLIPLDIIWIDSNDKVVFIAKNVQPCKSLICTSIYPPAKARYVLEINAGMSKEINLKLGDEIKVN